MNKTNKTFSGFLILVTTLSGLILGGCGGGGDSGIPPAVSAPDSPALSSTVVGVAATGLPIPGKVYLKDSGNAAEKTAIIGSDGYFAFTVDDLKPPFLLRAEWEDDTGRHALYSMAAGPGRANVNPLSNAAVAIASGAADISFPVAGLNSGQMEKLADALPGVVATLQEKLKPLLDQFNAATDPIIGTYSANHKGLDALFDAVAIIVANGNVLVINKENSERIFSCSTTDVASGLFNRQNMPGTPPAPTPTPTSTPTPAPVPSAGEAIYDNTCAGCHRLGTHDTNGSAPDLSGKYWAVAGRLTGGHRGISPTAAEIADLTAFISAK